MRQVQSKTLAYRPPPCILFDELKWGPSLYSVGLVLDSHAGLLSTD